MKYERKKRIYQMRLAILMIDISKKLQIFREKEKDREEFYFTKSVAAAASIYTCIYIICFDIGSCGFFSGFMNFSIRCLRQQPKS